MTDAEKLREFCERMNKRVTHASGYFVCHLCGHTAGGEAKWVAQVAEAHSCDALKAVRVIEELLKALETNSHWSQKDQDIEGVPLAMWRGCVAEAKDALSRAASKVGEKRTYARRISEKCW